MQSIVQIIIVQSYNNNLAVKRIIMVKELQYDDNNDNNNNAPQQHHKPQQQHEQRRCRILPPQPHRLLERGRQRPSEGCRFRTVECLAIGEGGGGRYASNVREQRRLR
mmetsp:Transcript_22735/g.42819  ORF Transcript_22735/g.42819 Transcript_22735/m.42819 type:complete len:108 (+) Transcript_22735:101-424(+)